MVRRHLATLGRAGLLAGCALSAACGNSAVDRGRTLYADHGCAVCHGAGGRGDGPSVKRLDVRPRDLTDRRGYRNGPGEDQIASSIRNGAGAMPPFRDLSEEDARDIAAWLVSLQNAAQR